MPHNTEPTDHPDSHKGAFFTPPQFVENALVAERRRLRSRRLAMGLPALVMVGLVIEPMASGAVLITPISGSLLWSMRLFGLLAGFSFALFTRDLLPVSQSARREGSLAAALPLVFFGAMGLASFDAFAWRAARWNAFAGLDLPYSREAYQLIAGPDGLLVRKGQVRIDPFSTGQPVAFRLAPEQVDPVSQMRGPVCITVMQQRSPSGAVEVLSDAWQPFGTPKAKPVAPCEEGGH